MFLSISKYANILKHKCSKETWQTDRATRGHNFPTRANIVFGPHFNINLMIDCALIASWNSRVRWCPCGKTPK